MNNDTLREKLEKSEIVQDFAKHSRLLKQSQLNPIDFFESIVTTEHLSSHKKSSFALAVAKNLKNQYNTPFSVEELHKLVLASFKHMDKYEELLYEDCEIIRNLPPVFKTICYRRFRYVMTDD